MLAFLGWGRLLEAGLRRRGGEPDAELPVGVAACLGLALSLGAVGPLVALGLFRVWLAVAWLAVGAVIAAGWTYRRARLERVALPAAVRLGALGLFTLFLLAQATRLAPVNLCDNEGAYLPLADRLGETGGLIEPFSQRRLGTLGGLTAMQAVFISLLGPANAYAADVIVGGLLVALLLLPGRADAGRVVLGVVTLAGFALWESGRNNLSPTYLTVALLAATVVQAARWSGAGRDRDALVGIGVLGGGLLALRVNHFLPWFVFAVLAAATAGRGWREGVKEVGLMAVVAVGAALPSMLALWRSSGTPLFPPFRGNLDPSWPGFRDPEIGSVGDYLDKLWLVVRNGETGWLLVAALAAGLATWILRRRQPAANAALLMLFAALTTMAVLVASLSAFLPIDLARLSWPLLAGTLVGGLVMLVGDRSRLAGPVAAAGIALVLALPLGDARTRISDTLQAARDIAAHGPSPQAPWSAVQDDYSSLQRRLPPGARVASATDFPERLNLDRNDAVNLDIVGSVSPPPHLPFFRGAAAKMRYLRREGIDFVVATDAARSVCLWSRRTWTSGAATEKPYSLWAPYFLDWFASLESLARAAPGRVRRYGSLTVYDVRR